MTVLSTCVLFALSTYMAINNLPQSYGNESPQGHLRSTLYKELTLSEIVAYLLNKRVPSRFQYSDEYHGYVENADGGAAHGGDKDDDGFVRKTLNHDVTHALVRAGIGMAPGGGAALAAYDAGKTVYGAANTPQAPPAGSNGGDGSRLKSALTGETAQKVLRTGIGFAPGGNTALVAYDVGTQLYNAYAAA